MFWSFSDVLVFVIIARLGVAHPRICQKRIIYGEPAAPELSQYACMLLIEPGPPLMALGRAYVCSGVLIDLHGQPAVLTAAHCFFDDDISGLDWMHAYIDESSSSKFNIFQGQESELRIGCGNDPSNHEITIPNEHLRGMIRLHKKFDFAYTHPERLIYDVAVIKLGADRDVFEVVSRYAKSGAWAFQRAAGGLFFQPSDGGECVILGYGAVEPDAHTAANHAIMGRTKALEFSECMYGKSNPQLARQSRLPYLPTCLVSPKNPEKSRASMCSAGDSGGPAFCRLRLRNGRVIHQLSGIITSDSCMLDAHSGKIKGGWRTNVAPLWHPTLMTQFIAPAVMHYVTLKEHQHFDGKA